MNIKPIKTDSDYREALREIDGLMLAEPNSPQGERLDVLSTLVEAYESRNFPMDLPDPHKELGIPAESLIKPGRT